MREDGVEGYQTRKRFAIRRLFTGQPLRHAEPSNGWTGRHTGCPVSGGQEDHKVSYWDIGLKLTGGSTRIGGPHQYRRRVVFFTQKRDRSLSTRSAGNDVHGFADLLRILGSKGTAMLKHVDNRDGGVGDDAAQGEATQHDAAAGNLVSNEDAELATPPSNGASSVNHSSRGGRSTRGARGRARGSGGGAVHPVPFGAAFAGRGRNRGVGIDPSQFEMLLVIRLVFSPHLNVARNCLVLRITLSARCVCTHLLHLITPLGRAKTARS